jgi:hypothetical protein
MRSLFSVTATALALTACGSDYQRGCPKRAVQRNRLEKWRRRCSRAAASGAPRRISRRCRGAVRRVRLYGRHHAESDL